MIPDPLPLVAAWTAGTAVAAALIAWYRVGGVGLRWLFGVLVAVGVVAMAATGASGGVVAGTGTGSLAAILVARRPRWATAGWLVASAAAFLPALAQHRWVAPGEVVLLGSITAGLVLGHWFLVDPHLPREPMTFLAWTGLAGLVLTGVSSWRAGIEPGVLGGVAAPVAVVSGVITAGVLAATPLALRVPTYKGVQSATGLFYVATMTVAGFVLTAAALRGAVL